MDCNACSTRLALHWMKASCNKTADAEKAAFFVNRMRFALGRFAMTFRVASDGFEIQVENWQNLFVDNAFLACNLQRNLRTTHLSVEQAWGSQWDSMLTDSDLQMPSMVFTGPAFTKCSALCPDSRKSSQKATEAAMED